MKPISKRTFFLSLLVLVLSRGSFAQTSPLKIQDFQMYKNTQRGEMTLFYHTVLHPSQISTPTSFTPRYEPLSVGETMAQHKMDSDAARHSIKKTWSQVRAFVRNSAQLYLIGELEAAPSEGGAMTSLALLKQAKANTISPRLSAGTDYVKPGVAVNNLFNTHIHTHISYQAQEETLEAKLSKKLSKTVECHLTNTNVFTDDRVKKIILGLSYRF